MSNQKIVELIDWTLENYRARIKQIQQNEQQVIIDNIIIIKELDKKEI
jgi:hypothetical protein